MFGYYDALDNCVVDAPGRLQLAAQTHYTTYEGVIPRIDCEIGISRNSLGVAVRLYLE